MEAPINPPDDFRQGSLGIIKQEAVVEQSKSGLQRMPEKSSLENVAQEKMKQRETAAGRSEVGSLEESFSSESNTEQSENKSSGEEKSQKLDQESHDDGGTMEGISESNTEQDTTGEAAGMDI